MTIGAACRILSCLAVLAVAVPPLPASAEGADWKPLLGATPLDDAEADSRGWARRSFALGSPAIDFTTFAPADATIETAPLDDRAPAGTLGKLKTVAKIKLAEADAPVEATIIAIQLSYAAAAPRVCDWMLSEAGYRISESRARPGLAEAQSLGFTYDGERRTGGAFGACFTRGETVLATVFLFDLGGDKPARDRTVTAARGFASGFLTNMAFADGKPSAFAADQITQLDLKLGTDVLPIAFPSAYTVRINDFQGPLPAELHLGLGTEDSTRGVLWFSAQERFGEMDFDVAGQKVADIFARTQSDRLRSPTLQSQGPAPALDAAGIKARTYLFTIERADSDSETGGGLEVTMVAHRGRFFALVLWTSKPASLERAVFFSRLRGLTAYDMVGEALVRALSEKTP